MTNTTARDSITIQGETFTVPQPYEAGDTLATNEASALNQVLAENLRNNFASKVKTAKENGTFDLDILQSELDSYADDYEFGVRGQGVGRSSDPIMTEAMEILRTAVRKSIKKSGGNLKDFSAKDISAKAKSYITNGSEAGQKALAKAKILVAQREEIADVELEDEAA